MKLILKKISLSLIWICLIAIMIWQKDYNIPLLAGIATVIFLIWTINMSTITNLSFDWNKKKIEMNRMYEETKKTADEVEVNATTFSKTIKAFLAFNLVDLQTNGWLLNIPWRDAANFVNEAIELKKVLNEEDEEISYLLLKSKAKVIELFKMDARDFFSADHKEYEKYISSGFKEKDDTIIFNSDNVLIDFQNLYELGLKVREEKQLAWKKNVDDLKMYYDKNFKQKLR
ncbi:hypothetical protein [Melissococcus plutonius]|uniref:hypothetical protein n=2 Tax=Melissococcus plutonius TaxID=33970 RepID=UPI003C2B6FA8